jgi:membrane fusion protein, multidrug efflux system
MKRRTVIIALIIVTLISLAAIRLARNKAKIDMETSYLETIENVPVSVQTVLTTSKSTELSFVGSFVASKEASVSAEIPGKIVKSFVSEGDFVNEGQIIAELDQSLLILKLESDQAQYEHSKEDLARHENLNKHEATSDVVLKQMRLTNSLNEIAVKTTKEQIAKSKIKAPISGHLTSKLFEVGTVVSPGTYIGQVTNTSALKFTTMVPEYQVVKLQLNQKVTIGADVFPNTKYAGVISQISEKGDQNHNYKVEVYINNNKQFPIKAGMNGAMTAIDKTPTAGIFVPRDVLQGTMAQPQVYLAVDNRAVLRNVVIGMAIGNDIQIVDGIRDGDKIITVGMNNLKDSTTIKVAAMISGQ